MCPTELRRGTRGKHRHASDLEPAEQWPVAVDEAEHRLHRQLAVWTGGQHPEYGRGLTEDAVDELRSFVPADDQVLRARAQQAAATPDGDPAAVALGIDDRDA